MAGPPPRRWPSRLFLPHLLQQQSPPVAPVGRGHPRRYLPLSRPGELRPRLPPHLLQTLPRQAVWSRRWASEAPSRGTWMASVAGTRTVTAGARRATGRHQTAKASSPRPLPCRLPTGRRYQCRLRHGHFRTHRYRVLWRRGSRRPSGQPQAAMAVQWGTARLGRQRARQKAGDSPPVVAAAPQAEVAKGCNSSGDSAGGDGAAVRPPLVPGAGCCGAAASLRLPSPAVPPALSPSRRPGDGCVCGVVGVVNCMVDGAASAAVPLPGGGGSLVTPPPVPDPGRPPQALPSGDACSRPPSDTPVLPPTRPSVAAPPAASPPPRPPPLGVSSW